MCVCACAVATVSVSLVLPLLLLVLLSVECVGSCAQAIALYVPVPLLCVECVGRFVRASATTVRGVCWLFCTYLLVTVLPLPLCVECVGSLYLCLFTCGVV
jgi:hypothetical protein